MSAILILFLLLNFTISWFNAWSVGKGWVETKALGGFARFMSWMGAIMSASGFSWCYLVLLCLVGQAIPGKYHLPDKYAEAIFRIGYLIIVLPVIGSGTAITVQSWMVFWRERTFKNGAVTAWNTFADVYNIYTAVRAIPESLSWLGDLWDAESEDSDGKSKLFFLLILAAIMCIVGGIVTTTVIVRLTARNHAEVLQTRLDGLRAQPA
jgi:hypothetical protein